MKRSVLAISVVISACSSNGRKVEQQPNVTSPKPSTEQTSGDQKKVTVINQVSLSCTPLQASIGGPSTTCSLLDATKALLPIAAFAAEPKWEFRADGVAEGVSIAVNPLTDSQAHVQYVFGSDETTVKSIADRVVLVLRTKIKADATNRLPETLEFSLAAALVAGAPADDTNDDDTPNNPANPDEPVVPVQPTPTPTPTPLPTPKPTATPTPTPTPSVTASSTTAPVITGPDLTLVINDFEQNTRDVGVYAQLVVDDALRAKIKDFSFRAVVPGTDKPMARDLYDGGFELMLVKPFLEIKFIYEGRRCEAKLPLPEDGTSTVKTTCGG